MRLTEISTGKTRVFGGTMPDGKTVSFVVTREGETEIGAELWLGKMKIEDGDKRDVALAVGSDGVVIAMNLAAPAAAIKDVFATRRRAFGPSLRPDRNWMIRGYNGTKLENYK